MLQHARKCTDGCGLPGGKGPTRLVGNRRTVYKGCGKVKFATYRTRSFWPILRQLGGRFVARTSFIILASLGVLTGVVFAVDPSLDLRVASFFYDLVAQPEVRRLNRVV